MGDFFRMLVAMFLFLVVIGAVIVALVVLDLDGSKKKPGGKRSLEYGVEQVLSVNPASRSVV